MGLHPVNFVITRSNPVFLSLALALAVCLVADELFSFSKPGNIHRIVELGFLTLATIYLCVKTYFGSQGLFGERKNLKLQVVCLILCCSVLYTCYASEFTLQSLQDAGLFCGQALLVIMLQHPFGRISSERIEAVMLVLLMPGLLYAFKLLILYLEMIGYAGFSLHHGSLPSFSNFRHFNNLQSIILPYYVYCAVSPSASSRIIGRIAYFVAVIWMLALLYTGARSVIVAFVLSAAIAMIIFPRSLFPNRRAVIKFLSCVAACYILFFMLIPAIQQDRLATYIARLDSSGRIELWAFSLRTLKECALGCGGQSFVIFTDQHYPQPFGSPHNLFFSLFIEYGFIAGFLSLFILLKLIRKLFSSVSTGLELVLFFSLSSFFIDSLFSGAIYSPLVGMIAPVWLAALLSRSPWKAKSNKPLENMCFVSVEIYINTALMAFLFCFFLLCLMISWADIMLYGAAIFEMTYSYPRFWEVGNFFL